MQNFEAWAFEVAEIHSKLAEILWRISMLFWKVISEVERLDDVLREIWLTRILMKNLLKS